MFISVIGVRPVCCLYLLTTLLYFIYMKCERLSLFYLVVHHILLFKFGTLSQKNSFVPDNMRSVEIMQIYVCSLARSIAEVPDSL